jgi:hypothetical protein
MSSEKILSRSPPVRRLEELLDVLCSQYKAQSSDGDGHRRIELQRLPAGVEVRFPNGRKQILRFKRRDGLYILETTVMGAARVESIGITTALRMLFAKNRETDVVTFALDKANRMVAYVHQLADTLDLAELEFYAIHLAQESDSLEYALAGVDIT